MMTDILVIDCRGRGNFWMNLKSDHKILFATSAYEGLNLLSDNVGLVFLNLRLLDSNGVEVLRLIKKAYPSIEVIIISSCGADDPCAEAFNKGASDFIRRPLNAEDILQKIKALINTSDDSQKRQQLPPATEPARQDQYPDVPPHIAGGILKVKDFIARNYSESLTLDAACKMASISKTYFCHFFKRITGYSLRNYHHVVKIKVAEELLKDKRLSIQDIAQQLGYGDVNYFSAIYRRMTGFSPRRKRPTDRYEDTEREEWKNFS